MAGNTTEQVTLMVRDFSRVILTLDNVLLPEDKLYPTPSMADGLDPEDEQDLRIQGCELIQTAGNLLKLPQVAKATGQVLFQRFYYSKSFVKHPMEIVAMACLNLAAKIEESPRRPRDVLNVFHHMKQVKNKKMLTPMNLDQNYINLKNQVIKAERRVLKELGFCVHVKHPHKIIVMYLQTLKHEKNQPLVQCSWNYMNDSLRTNVFVRFKPETIACACIYLAARKLRVPLPVNIDYLPERRKINWFDLFGAVETELKTIALDILRLYIRQKPNMEKIDETVNQLKKSQTEARLKARGIRLETTPNNSRPGTPMKGESPLSSQLKKIKSEDDRHSEASFGRSLEVPSKKRARRDHSKESRHSGSHSGSAGAGSYHRARSRSLSRSPEPKRRSPLYRSDKDYKRNSDHYSSKDSKRYDSKEISYSDYNSKEYSRSRKQPSDKDDRRKRLPISPISYPKHGRRSSISPPPPKSKKSSKDKYYSYEKSSRSPSRERSYDKKSKRHTNGHRSRSKDRHRR